MKDRELNADGFFLQKPTGVIVTSVVCWLKLYNLCPFRRILYSLNLVYESGGFIGQER